MKKSNSSNSLESFINYLYRKLFIGHYGLLKHEREELRRRGREKCLRCYGVSLLIILAVSMIYGISLSVPLLDFKIDGREANFITYLYFSVVTFTTLGFGDVIPLNHTSEIWLMIEVILGYIMLGGLISIFANKLARRS